MSDVPSSKIVLLKDLKDYKVGDSVRITGIWIDCNGKVGLIDFEQVQVEVDLEKIEQKLPAKGELVQCLGEIKERNVISARILRSVNTLDMELYKKVVDLLNKKQEI